MRDGRKLTLDVTPTPRFNEELQIYMGVLGVKSVGAGARSSFFPGVRLSPRPRTRFECRS